MRKVKFAMMILAASLLTACGSSKKEQSVNEETAAARTQETENLLANLKKIPSKGIMLGHHDDTVYGIGWEGEEGLLKHDGDILLPDCEIFPSLQAQVSLKL